MTFNVTDVRDQFPSLHQQVDGVTPIFFDNPAGTQVPQRVISAVSDYYLHKNSNQGAAYARSQATDAMVYEARALMADMLHADRPEEIVFGPNMTTLNFNLSRAIAQTLPDDAEIVLTKMDHDANIAPWLTIARDHDWTVKWVELNTEDGTLDMASFEDALSEKTRLVAAVHASNALGTINPVAQMAEMAHQVGALFVMDAVQSAPHLSIDVHQLGCDVVLCSAYKFFGPHIGVMWGRYDLLESLPAYKVRPAKDVTPYRWESGTPSFETIAGTAEAARYLASFGDDTPHADYTGRALHFHNAFTTLQAYENQLSAQLLTGLTALPHVTVAGITATDRVHQRVATVSFMVDGMTPLDVATQMWEQHRIQVWKGNYYAVEVMNAYDQSEQGMVRVGAVHYNTAAEIDRFLNALEAIS
jgi:cysteine desulfurase family protein (TIGR01976 family)